MIEYFIALAVIVVSSIIVFGMLTHAGYDINKKNKPKSQVPWQ